MGGGMKCRGILQPGYCRGWTGMSCNREQEIEILYILVYILMPMNK